MEPAALAQTTVNLLSSYLQNEAYFATLRRQLVDYFNEGELRDLAFDLRVNYDSLPGSGTGDKARELIALCLRQNRLLDLLRRCEELRPNVFTFPDTAGENTISEDAGNIYAALKRQFGEETYGAQTLARLAEQPQSSNRQAMFLGFLTEQIQDEPALAQLLRSLLQGSQPAGGDTISQRVSLSDQARAGNISLVGKIEEVHQKKKGDGHDKGT